jgi:phage FluMu protein Com
MLEVVKCASCFKKLAMVEGYVRLEIKCGRCGTLNSMRAASSQSERPGASVRGIYGEGIESTEHGGHGG